MLPGCRQHPEREHAGRHQHDRPEPEDERKCAPDQHDVEDRRTLVGEYAGVAEMSWKGAPTLTPASVGRNSAPAHAGTDRCDYRVKDAHDVTATTKQEGLLPAIPIYSTYSICNSYDQARE